MQHSSHRLLATSTLRSALLAPTSAWAHATTTPTPSSGVRVRRRFTIRAAGVAVALTLVLASACSSSQVASAPSEGRPTGHSTLPSAAVTASELRLVVVGDSIPFSSFCAGCRGFVDQYAAALEQATGRAVAVSNRSRDDSATLDDIVSQVTSDESLRTELGGADVVLVSVGFNDGPPYPPDRPCHSQPADTAEGQVQALLASTPECIDQTALTYEADYAAAFGEIETLTPPTSALMALTVYNNWLGHPELAAAATGDDLTRVTALTKRTFDAWNEMLCKVASQHRFRCVDVYHAFNGKDADQPAGANLGGDYSHPSQQGNDVITGLLKSANITAKSG